MGFCGAGRVPGARLTRSILDAGARGAAARARGRAGIHPSPSWCRPSEPSPQSPLTLSSAGRGGWRRLRRRERLGGAAHMAGTMPRVRAARRRARLLAERAACGAQVPGARVLRDWFLSHIAL